MESSNSSKKYSFLPAKCSSLNQADNSLWPQNSSSNSLPLGTTGSPLSRDFTSVFSNHFCSPGVRSDGAQRKNLVKLGCTSHAFRRDFLICVLRLLDSRPSG